VSVSNVQVQYYSDTMYSRTSLIQ